MLADAELGGLGEVGGLEGIEGLKLVAEQARNLRFVDFDLQFAEGVSGCGLQRRLRQLLLVPGAEVLLLNERELGHC